MSELAAQGHLTRISILRIGGKVRDLASNVEIGTVARWLKRIIEDPRHIAFDDATNALGVLVGEAAFDKPAAIAWLQSVVSSTQWSPWSREYAAVLLRRLGAA